MRKPTPIKISFKQSRNIKDFRPLIDTLIGDFDYGFLWTILEWCKLAGNDDDHAYWEFWLVLHKKDVIGICGLYSKYYNTNEELWLNYLGVVPKLRNKGIGRHIMQHLYVKAKKAGCKTIMSYVGQSGDPLNFYKREGFEVLGRVKQYVRGYELREMDSDEVERAKEWVIRKEIAQ
jgi:GNAT superfamily N-acetyltransferase